MKTLKSEIDTVRGDAEVMNGVRSAVAASKNFVNKAVIAGQMLIEKRHELSLYHDATNLPWKGASKPEKDSFTHWIKSNCSEISRQTAYRWIGASERVISVLLELEHPEPQVRVNLDGESYFISEALLMPESVCGQEVQKLQAAFNTFLENKTLSEAACDSFDGKSKSHRVTLAHNGKSKGGTNEWDDRKEWEVFIARKFQDLSSHFKHWEKMTIFEKSEALSAMKAVIFGIDYNIKNEPENPGTNASEKIGFRGLIRSRGIWPPEVCEGLIQILKERLKK